MTTNTASDRTQPRCGRRTKTGSVCRTPVARPGLPCAGHRRGTELTLPEARQVLAQLDSGALDMLPAAARATLRTGAEAALDGDDPEESS
jgi:hypothetical protein